MQENHMTLYFRKISDFSREGHWRHGHTHRDELRIILNDQSIDLLPINQNVFGTSLEIFGRLRKSSDIFGFYQSTTKNLDTLRIKMSRL